MSYSYKYYIRIYNNGIAIKFCDYKLSAITRNYTTETYHKFPRSCYKQVKSLVENFKTTHQNKNVEIDVMCWFALSIDICSHADKFSKN